MAESNQQGCLFVGEGVVLKGNFEVPDIASVSGVIEGELSAKQVIVEASGVIRGKVTGESVDVRGEITENLTATRSLIIRPSGKVSGVVNYAEIEIEKGGHIYGDLNLIGQGFTQP
jgi:cytoskeletal protein CcmA (bactofilin family)